MMRPSSCPRADADAATGPQPHTPRGTPARRTRPRTRDARQTGGPATLPRDHPPRTRQARRRTTPARRGTRPGTGMDDTGARRPADRPTGRQCASPTARQDDSTTARQCEPAGPCGPSPGRRRARGPRVPAPHVGVASWSRACQGLGGGAGYAPTRPSPVSPPKDEGRKSRTPSGSTSRSIRLPDQESTGAPKASPIAPPSRHPRTRSAYDT